MKQHGAEGFKVNTLVISGKRSAPIPLVYVRGFQSPLPASQFSAGKGLANLSFYDILCELWLALFRAHFSCLSVTKDHRADLMQSARCYLPPGSTSSLHPLLRPVFYCRILLLSLASSDPCYLPRSVVSLPVADIVGCSSEDDTDAHKIEEEVKTFLGYMQRVQYQDMRKLGGRCTETHSLSMVWLSPTA